ncbi:MAG: efflux RND transporter permease subunit [Candidatus Marinimicrobia bacterium]|nr:efflux RND transporter permease subunit [Candidatus Neomarinimicrobiota bacterium]
MKLFQAFIRNWRVVIILLVLLPILSGSMAFMSMPKEFQPDVAIPIIVVVIPYPGTPPDQIESLITNKVEDGLQGLKDVDYIISTSSQGSVNIIVKFDIDADIDEKLRDVRTAVDDIQSELPDDVMDPIVMEINFSNQPILVLSFSGEDYVELTKTADKLKTGIEGIPNVLNCDVVGGREREFSVNLDPAKLEKYRLTLDAIIGLIKSENLEMPGGTIELADKNFTTSVSGKINDVYDLRNITVKGLNNSVMRLSDIAEIVDGYKEQTSYSRLDGKPAITLSIQKRQGSNTLEVSEDVMSYMQDAKDWLPAGTKFAVTGDQSKWIKQSLSQVTQSGLQGLVLVVLLLYLFLGFRNSLIAAIVIPLTILISFTMLWLMDVSLNTITLFSIVLVIGMIVDNAIVVVENIYRHLGEFKRRYIGAIALNIPHDWQSIEKHSDELDKVSDDVLEQVDEKDVPHSAIRTHSAVVGVQEVAMPILTSTLTTVAAFIPMLIMPGTMGDFMKYIPITVSIALIASFLVGIIVNPTISSKIMRLPIIHKKRKNIGRKLTEKIQNFYGPILRKALEHRLKFLSFVPIYVLGAVLLFTTGLVKIELFPPDDIGQIYIKVETPISSTVEETDFVVKQVEKVLLKGKYAQYMEAFVSNVGYEGASSYDFSFGGSENFAQIVVDLVEEEERDKTVQELQNWLRTDLKHIAGAKIEMPSVGGGPSSEAPVGLKIIGVDYDVLKEISGYAKSELEKIDGAINIKDDIETGGPQITFDIDRVKSANLMVSTSSIINAVRTAIAGVEATTVRLGDDDVKVLVRLSENWRNSLTDIENIKIANRQNQNVLLKEVVKTKINNSLSAIKHYDGDRIVRITADNDENYSAVEISKKLKNALLNYNMPTGYRFDYSGDFEQFNESFVALGKAFIIALILIYVLMVAQFRSFSQPITIIITIPLGVIGAIYGLFIGGANFALIALIAIVGLSGVVVNISIILLDYINRLVDKGMELNEAIVQASLTRIRPILLTTLTTIIGLLPLTYAEKSWQPLGFSFIFGLGFAMPLTLIVIPIVHSYVEGYRIKREK